ncbi:hypothetical protein DF185_06960 [Marinifilum breve]|uniref:Tail specific protease domain-containing protein n=1 Tax=Marinifilum breve TaxID=2184082 RepID=A0A2V4A1D3_9BACT|nr:S41 family peptidase [Marinifilum breve]PXY02381.1 hypothetical protein DF185_06960 [Marinifilum breve]
MKHTTLTLLILFLFQALYAQVDYHSKYREAIASIEKNYAGFKDKTAEKEDYYEYFKAELEKDSIRGLSTLKKRLKTYISFFDDNHLKLYEFDAEKYVAKKQYKIKAFNFKMLDDNTCYLKIPHFMYKSRVDSLINHSIDSISSKKNLIIDIRGNGGGGDDSFSSILPIIATNDMYIRNIEFLATKANWEFVNSVLDIGKWKEEYDDQMIPAPWISSRKFLVKGNDEINGVNEFPKNVAVLVDREVGSAGEQFLFCAKQSFKVKVFGENTGGTIDYSNCRHFKVIKDKIYIQAPTTKFSGLPVNQIDKHGIAPDFYLNKENQIEQVLKYFEIWR